MENHHFQWENPLCLWPFSIAFCMFTRGYTMVYPNISQNGRRSPPPWAPGSPGFGGCREWHPAQQAATCLKCRISTCHIIAVVISVYSYSISPMISIFLASSMHSFCMFLWLETATDGSEARLLAEELLSLPKTDVVICCRSGGTHEFLHRLEPGKFAIGKWDMMRNL